MKAPSFDSDAFVARLSLGVERAEPLAVRGRVQQVVGTIVRAHAPGAKIGELCALRNPWEEHQIMAEVVGFSQNLALLTPLGELVGASGATEVIPLGEVHRVPVGPGLLGRVLDGLGRPLDQKGPLEVESHYPVYADPPNAMARDLITQPISLGLRALDGLLTCGEGQRMGIFAAAGGGKSTLLSQIVRNTTADVVVLALIGERGREVREFLERDLGEDGVKRAVTVISTSDRPSMERLKAAYVATAVAEYFRDQGKKVLLLMDSVTRFARALREIGLAAGEPPTRRGFPPFGVCDPAPAHGARRLFRQRLDHGALHRAGGRRRHDGAGCR
jgi:type III secretion protein N (ATPase)